MMLFSLFTLLLGASSELTKQQWDAGIREPLAESNLGSPNCNTFSDCNSCASAKTWTGSHCRWCTKDSLCHAEGSLFDPCSSSEIVTDPTQCAVAPTTPPLNPTPAPVLPKVGPDVTEVVAALFKALGITDVDASACVSDVGDAGVALEHFGDDVKGKNLKAAVGELANAISALSTSVSGCGVPELKTKLDAFAAAIKWANVTIVDNAITVIVDASDLWEDLQGLAAAVQSGDTNAMATALGKLMDDWTTITGGCSGDSKVCKLIDGILRVLRVTAADIAPCENAMLPAFTNLTAGATAFEQHDYKTAVADMAFGLDLLAKATVTDACGLGPLSKVLLQVAPKLAQAIITDLGNVTQIVVENADIYDELYTAVQDLINGDMAGFGMEMGLLLQKLQASGCKTKLCIVLQGILNSLEIEGEDFEACSSDLDASWDDISEAITDLGNKQWKEGITKLGGGFAKLASGVSDCGIPDLAKVLEDVSAKLGLANVPAIIGEVVTVLVDGADVTLDLQQVVRDFETQSWSSVGHDLGDLANILNSTKCSSFVCELLEGILTEAGIVFDHLEQCEVDLSAAEDNFLAGKTYFQQGQIKTALGYFASGINQVAKAVKDCGVEQELDYLEHEANVLGLGAGVQVLDEVVHILIHGSDVYADLFAAVEAMEGHDWRTAGKQIQQVLDEMSQWTKGHVCTSDFCYVVVGIFQFLGDIEGSVTACKNDFEGAFHNFTTGFDDLVQDGHFSHDKDQIDAGLKDLGQGLVLVSHGVSDCHIQEFADLIAALATKLGIAPEVEWIEEVLKILIEGAEIEQEIGDAIMDYADQNWAGFGYNLIKLIKTLI